MLDRDVRAKMTTRAIVGFIVGSSILYLFSFIQKFALGVNPFLFEGYLVPICYGGITGVLLGTKCLKVSLLNQELAARNNMLEGLLPICSHCKAIREPGKESQDQSSWYPVEKYLSMNTTGQFTHGICPNCFQENYPQFCDGNGHRPGPGSAGIVQG
jgi:hypothetical protein